MILSLKQQCENPELVGDGTKTENCRNN